MCPFSLHTHGGAAIQYAADVKVQAPRPRSAQVLARLPPSLQLSPTLVWPGGYLTHRLPEGAVNSSGPHPVRPSLAASNPLLPLSPPPPPRPPRRAALQGASAHAAVSHPSRHLPKPHSLPLEDEDAATQPTRASGPRELPKRCGGEGFLMIGTRSPRLRQPLRFWRWRLLGSCCSLAARRSGAGFAARLYSHLTASLSLCVYRPPRRAAPRPPRLRCLSRFASACWAAASVRSSMRWATRPSRAWRRWACSPQRLGAARGVLGWVAQKSASHHDTALPSPPAAGGLAGGGRRCP